jgi:ribonucleoside-triphosphate reductase (thioredoxin)
MKGANAMQYRRLLTHQFLKGYKDFPEHMNTLGSFVYLRTYSRFLAHEGRRETWKETVRRAVEYNVNLAITHYERIGVPVDIEEFKKEAEEWFDSQYNLQQFLSGRTLWVGGSENGVADKYPLANFNCSFTNIAKWKDLGDLFYLLLVGTGVGFKATKKMAKGLEKVKIDVEVEHMPYVGKIYHLENSRMGKLSEEEYGEGVYGIDVGDSKEGWVEALNFYFEILTKSEYKDVKKIIFSYDAIREKGKRLNTFGGTASGPQPLMDMFTGFSKVLKNEIDPTLAPIEADENGYGHVRPIHILDMGNMVGNNVVVGGVENRLAPLKKSFLIDLEPLVGQQGASVMVA